MASTAFLLLVVLAMFFAPVYASWLNNYDKDVKFSCPSGQVLSYVASTHHNSYEDRRFDLRCRSPPVSGTLKQCFWTQYVNAFDEPVVYQCPHDGFLAGMRSYHSNDYEDRRYSFYCCRLPGYVTYECSYTGFVNQKDQTFYYSAPNGRVLKGMVSFHDDKTEDRSFQFDTCLIKKK
ncbi:dermatopontin-like [Littorina saxatilis]|uniref:Dermatopontin n=1 Tax=Littorina saxatilis TaxID=31220 RepID=A0AAN9AKH8_9CAEN